TNTVNVTAGGLMLGTSSNYPSTTVNVGAAGTLDMRGVSDLQVGALTGSGTVKNFNPTTAGTLVVGSLGTDFQFDGTLSSDYSTGFLNVTKIGAGKMTLTADNSAKLLGTLAVSSGNVQLDGASARLGFTTYTLNAIGTLTLDNSTNGVAGRLGVGTTSAF